MGLPLQLRELLPQQVPALRLLTAPPLDVEPERLRGVIRELAELLEALGEFERELNSSYDKLRASGTEASDPEGLQEVVQAVQALERNLAEKWAEAQARTELLTMRARELSSREPLWTKYADLISRATESVVRLLEALRDIRLELAVILTEADVDVDSPTFADPKKLKAYLESV